MKEIDIYVDNLCKNMNCRGNEAEELKREIKEHLLETINELQREGKSKEESFKIAVERFGETNELRNELSEVVHMKNPILNILNIASIVSIIVLSIVLIIACKDADTIKAPVLILLVPAYIIFRIRKINKSQNGEINSMDELLKFMCMLYGIILIGGQVFPIEVSNFGFQGYPNIDFHVLPLLTVEENINNMGLSSAIFSIIRAFLMYLPIGLFLPIISERFRKLSNCIMVYIIGSAIVIMIKILFNMVGLHDRVFVSFDYSIIRVIGITMGYMIYKKMSARLVIA